MALTASSNILSLSGQRALLANLIKSQADYTHSAERIATGLRINRASDDPSGNALVGRFTAQINGIEQATRNVGHALSFMKTAESDLATMDTLLQDIRSLIVEGQNVTTPEARLEVQAKIAPLLLELERVAQNSEFDGRKLFNTASQNFVYQVGPNAADLVSVQTSDFRISQQGVYRLLGADTSAGTAARNGVGEKLTVNGAVGSRTLTLPTSTNVRATAEQVNLVKQFTGVEASAKTEADVSGWVAGTYRLLLAGDNATTISVNIPIETITNTGGTSLSFDEAILAINAVTYQTGIVASLNAAALASQTTGIPDAAAGITLTNDKGNNITVGQPTDTGFLNPGTELKLAGSVNGASVGGTTTTVVASGASTRIITGQVTFFSDRSFGVISTQDLASPPNYPTAGLTLKKPTSGTFASESSVLSPLSQLDVTTIEKAKLALSTLDNALDGLNRQRASIGSSNFRFEKYILTNLAADGLNLDAARDNIRGADEAVEILNRDFAENRYLVTLQLLSDASALQKSVLTLLG